MDSVRSGFLYLASLLAGILLALRHRARKNVSLFCEFCGLYGASTLADGETVKDILKRALYWPRNLPSDQLALDF